MGANTIGVAFALTTFGESHGVAIGGIVDGCPAGLVIDYDFIITELQRRKTQNEYGTQRNEEDKVIFLSGLQTLSEERETNPNKVAKQYITLGTPIGFLIENKDVRTDDYADINNDTRPNHAEFTYFTKYEIRSASGGGRASARETATRVIGGAIAKTFLKHFNINIAAEIETIGSFNYITQREEVEKLLKEIKANGDTAGGKICCKIENVPAGVGEPVFEKYSASLAKAMLSIPSVKSFEIGKGIEITKLKGSENILSDGLQGGISNGKTITFSTGFKPVSSFNCKGRHDVCQLFRSLVIVESMAAMVTADLLLRQRSNRI
ncbi:MAG: chorismate synthase [Bacteroidales bacterium]|jgi:chorismate synthase|nr:chorismate synthase [Bacteroidales bacterium]